MQNDEWAGHVLTRACQSSPTRRSSSDITVNNGKLGGCNNDVTSGAVTLSAKISNANCASLASPPNTAKPTTGTENITWVPASEGTSTILVTLGTVKGKPTETTLSGTVASLPGPSKAPNFPGR